MSAPSQPYKLIVPKVAGDSLEIEVSVGETLFVLGANGTGKSNLMQQFFSLYRDTARRLSAHRQNWFHSITPSLSPEQRRSTGDNIRNHDAGSESRWRDDYSSYRPNIAVYDLVDAENVRARSIAEAFEADDLDLARRLATENAPIKKINELLRLSNMAIQISLEANDQVMARKAGSEPYSIAYLSDGERNALLVAADVLTVKPGTLILIDEPERHLHRSIISPLLSLLFKARSDCAFVISTHEVMLPLDNPLGRVLLLRDCRYSSSDVTSWDADLVAVPDGIDDDIKRHILGGRRKLLFIEGDEHSLDKPLYSLVFPNVSIIPKASCRDVENAVAAIRSASGLHWLHPFGIVDNDGRTATEINELKTKGVYALSVFSVESIYYAPEVQKRVVERHVAVVGGDANQRLADASAAVLSAVTPHIQRLSRRVAEKTIREQIMTQLPGQTAIAAGTPVNITLDVSAVVAAERTRFENYLTNGNVSEIVRRYPVRETSALTDIARKLGFQSREQYESAVRRLLMDDSDALNEVKSFFGSLLTDITAA